MNFDYSKRGAYGVAAALEARFKMYIKEGIPCERTRSTERSKTINLLRLRKKTTSTNAEYWFWPIIDFAP